MYFNQSEFDIRCEWGENGVLRLAPISDVVIIVDVLSFSTCVEIAASRGALIFPYRWNDDRAVDFARSQQAELADSRPGQSKYSLSPKSLTAIPSGTRLVLPSPNGAALSLATDDKPTLAGCLRNYRAVALETQQYGKRIAVIPAGERWPDRSLRPSFEDWIGAGAIISLLPGNLSPEARSAQAVFDRLQGNIELLIRQCGSGKELIARDLEENVRLASACDVSECVPRLVDRAYVGNHV